MQSVSSRQSEPRVTLFASDPGSMKGFGTMHGLGGPVTLAALGSHELYLNKEAADKLAAAPGDPVVAFAGDNQESFTVKDVVRWDGALDSDEAALAPLATAQRLLHEPGRIEHILVSNRGGTTSGAGLSDTVVNQLAPTLSNLGLSIDTNKQDGLELADEQGNGFMSLFTTFGTFSIVAGIMLIFLLFVMLAAERRGELGIARAIGTRRSHLVQMYLFEGVAYDLMAAIVGVALGVAVALGMVYVLARAVRLVRLRHHVPRDDAVARPVVRARRAADAHRGGHLGLARERPQHHVRGAQPARSRLREARPPALDPVRSSGSRSGCCSRSPA